MFLSSDVDPARRGPLDDFWYQPIGLPSAAGVRVSPEAALSVSTLYACALVLAQTLATVPLPMYRRLQRGKERATDHALYRLIHTKPNRWQTAYQWRQMMQWHLVLRYNAYSRILSNDMGMPVELIPLHPDRVTVERIMGADDIMSFRYRYKPVGREPILLTRFEVLHLRGLTSDGIEGFSPLEVQNESIGEAIAAQRYNARRMRNDARPGGVLQWEGHFKTDDERKEFRRSWQEAQAGVNQGKTAVLERGMTWNEIGIKNTDLQFIELRKLKSFDICAIYRMPPHKVANLDRATFSNIEQSSIEFITDTMMPWFVNWEQELSAQLLTEEEQQDYFVEFLADGLLRGDSATRSQLYAKRFNTGSLSPNDIRELENENPIEGGDRYFVPVNMMPLDRADDVVNNGGLAPASSAPSSRELELERGNAARIVNKETQALRRAFSRDGFAEAARAFYAAHADFVAGVMLIDGALAADYCAMRMEQLEAALEAGGVPAWLADLEANGADQLLQTMREAREKGTS